MLVDMSGFFRRVFEYFYSVDGSGHNPFDSSLHPEKNIQDETVHTRRF